MSDPQTIDPTLLAPEVAAIAEIPSMEQFRDQLFRDTVVDRLRAGVKAGMTPEQVLQTMAAEQRALAEVVKAPETIATAADLLFMAQKSAATTSFAVSHEEAADTMGQILVRRSSEATGYAELLGQPAFANEMLAAAQAANDAPRFARSTLHDVKAQEMLAELKHAGPDGKTQVLAHIKQAQQGTILQHGALAQVFLPDGPLLNTLVAGLATHLPEADASHLQSIAAPWLNDRMNAALATVDVSRNDGAAYVQAVADSKRDHVTGRVALVPAASHAERAVASKAVTDLVQL